MFKKYKKFSLFIFTLVILSAFVLILSGCGGGGNGGGGGGGSSDNPPANSSTPDATPPQTPPDSVPPAPDNKGALITITMPDHSATAVLVGICDYPGEENDLRFTAKDALDFKNSLIGSPSWSGANVDIQNNIQVTKEKILAAVSAAKNNTADNGLFIFLYSGHGTNSGSTGYIIPYDGAYGYSWMISENELRNWLDSFPSSSKKYVLLDACYTGSFIDKSAGLKSTLLKNKFMKMNASSDNYTSEKFVKSLVGSSNTYVMTSSKESETSFESYDLQSSVFVYYVCEGLGSGSTNGPADANSNNIITAAELSSYVPSRVNNYVVNSSYYYYTQQPQSYNNCDSDIIIKGASAGNPDPAPDPTPGPNPDPTPSPGSGDGGDIIITISKSDSSACAVLVGMADYPGTENDLTYTVNDAIDFKNSLIGSSFWSGANVNIQNISATKSVIQAAVANAKNTIANDGLFIFLYSGHGSNSGGTGYLIPYDGVDSVASRISEDDLRGWIDSFSVSSKKYIIIDSCYSGNFIDKNLTKGGNAYMKAKTIFIKGSDPAYKSEKFAKSLTGLSNTYVITSSKGSEVSWESGYLKNGVFVYYICEGLGAGAEFGPADSNINNAITAEEIGAYAPSRTNNYVYNSSNGSYTQQPQIYDNYSGELRTK